MCQHGPSFPLLCIQCCLFWTLKTMNRIFLSSLTSWFLDSAREHTVLTNSLLKTDTAISQSTDHLPSQFCSTLPWIQVLIHSHQLKSHICSKSESHMQRQQHFRSISFCNHLHKRWGTELMFQVTSYTLRCFCTAFSPQESHFGDFCTETKTILGGQTAPHNRRKTKTNSLS